MLIPRRSLLTGLIAVPAAGAAGALLGGAPAGAAPAAIDRTAFKLRRRAAPTPPRSPGSTPPCPT
ncbi:hypothetical protein ACFQY4_11430 [Catellatospora bangladeshensis]|uniref:hypothetical protein n=1 Tax=Catellatospora bangladeshensis TaxID=310355 RepID=UPI003610C8DB